MALKVRILAGAGDAQAELLPSGSVALPRVSKQLLNEVTQFTWAAARPKDFQCYDTFARLTPYLQAIYLRDTLRCVSIHFSNDRIFRFVGFMSQYRKTSFTATEDVGISQLRNLVALQQLRFCF